MRILVGVQLTPWLDGGRLKRDNAPCYLLPGKCNLNTKKPHTKDENLAKNEVCGPDLNFLLVDGRQIDGN